MDSHETKIYIAILIAAGVLAVIITFFIITIVKHHKKNVQLYKEKLKAEVSTLEKERKRMASDLHDDLGPLLAGVKLQISMLDAASETDATVIQKATTHLDTILKRIREISNNLIPSVLMRHGLLVAVEDFIHTINNSGKMKVELNVNNDRRLPPNMEVHLYRVIHEILHNCIKHASATECHINYRLEPSKLFITIKDNGVGFDHEQVKQTAAGGGLRNILSRVEILNGEMFVEAAPGKGTQYTIEIPVDNVSEVRSLH